MLLRKQRGLRFPLHKKGSFQALGKARAGFGVPDHNFPRFPALDPAMHLSTVFGWKLYLVIPRRLCSAIDDD